MIMMLRQNKCLFPATFGYGPDLSQPYPFSVKVDKPLTVQDIMNMNRDQFEGTPFDLSVGIGRFLFSYF
jgi:hypothetical protein